jgi:hypothetical protein
MQGRVNRLLQRQGIAHVEAPGGDVTFNAHDLPAGVPFDHTLVGQRFEFDAVDSIHGRRATNLVHIPDPEPVTE